MPELPEVETTRSGIEPYIIGRTITQLIIRQPKLRWPIPLQLPELMEGGVISEVQRRAKYLLLIISVKGESRGKAIVHLGMSGSLRVISADEPPMAHDHVDIRLDSGKALRFADPRRFGCLLWQSEADKLHPLLASLGPEPLSDAFDIEH